MVRKFISLTLCSTLLGAGLWLLYLQIFVWKNTIGLVLFMTGFMILIGLAWLLGDFILPFFPRGQALLMMADDALTRGNAALGRGYRRSGAAIVTLVRAAFWFAGLAAVLAAIACWVFQGYTWLKSGEWLSIPTRAFIQLGSTGWVGVDKILEWLFDLNVGIPLLFVGFWTMALSVMDQQ